MQNLLCAGQAAAALVAVLVAGGLPWLDPVAALLIAGVAMKEGVELWRDEQCDCHSVPGLERPVDDCCA